MYNTSAAITKVTPVSTVWSVSPSLFSMMINSIGESIPDSSLHNAVAVLYEPPLRLPPRLGGRRVGPEALGHRRQAGPHAGLHSVLVDLLNVHITLILCFL